METVYADQLYEFLTEIVETAESGGNQDIVRRVDDARKHYVIQLRDGKSHRLPLTSEFLGESMLALREVLEEWPSILSPTQAKQARKYADLIRRQWFSP